jgi:hypothetical protein
MVSGEERVGERQKRREIVRMGEEDSSLHLEPKNESGKSCCCPPLFRLWQWRAGVKPICPSSLIWGGRKPGDSLLIKMLRSRRTLGSKVLNLGHLEESSNLYWGQIFIERQMRIFHFRSPFRPSLVRLYKRHHRGESEGIFEWVLLLAKEVLA